MKCDSSYVKSSGVNNGLIGLDQRYNRYYEVDVFKKEVKVATLNGSFSSSSWNSNVIKDVKNVDMYSAENTYVRDFTETETTISLVFADNSSNIDKGYTGISLYNGAQGSWNKEGSAVANGRSLIYAEPCSGPDCKIGIYRP